MVSNDWYIYTFQELNFRILFPFKPNTQIKSIETNLGVIKQSTAWCLKSDSSKIEFQVIVSEYGSEVFENPVTDSLKHIIQLTLAQEMQFHLEGQTIYENFGELNGIPCYWFLIKYKDQYAVKSCLIWNENNLISLIHYSDYNNRLSTHSDRFFNSFTLFSKK